MFDIENANTEGLGLYFKRGSLFGELLKLPKPKEKFFNDWVDDHGKDYDSTTPTFYEALKYSIGCYLIADDIGDLQDKRTAILSLISNPAGFILYSQTLGRGFHLRYLDSPSFRNMTPLFAKGKLYCEFTLELENNFAPTDTEFYLADDQAYILTENNEYITITEKQRNF